MLAPISGCVVSVAGILQAWYDMWFIPAGSQSHNKNDTCVYTAMLLTFPESHNKHFLSGANNQQKWVKNALDFAVNALMLIYCIFIFYVIAIWRSAAQRWQICNEKHPTVTERTRPF